MVEAIPEPDAQPGIDLTQEEVDGIQESEADFADSGFETSGPEAIEEIGRCRGSTTDNRTDS